MDDGNIEIKLLIKRLNKMAGVMKANGGTGQVCQAEVLRDFRLQELIGCGSFAEVYTATHLATNEVLAIKCFRHSLKTSQQYRHAAKEIAFMRILSGHPNIIELKAYEISPTFVFLATEYAPFGSLRSFLHSKLPIRPPLESVIREVMSQVLSALDYMHLFGIFHGDLKPDNILCTNMRPEGPQIKICDFGLAELHVKGTQMTYTAGSFIFMAPEVHFRNIVDQTCDLWSAGIVMYYMMFTRTIFNLKDTDREKQLDFMRRRVPPIFRGAEIYSKECLDLVKKLLSYNREDRPTGEALRNHPFLKNIEPPKVLKDQFARDAARHIDEALCNNGIGNHGEALVNAIQTIIECKIHYNLCELETDQKLVKCKWLQYENFAMRQEKKLVSAPHLPLAPKDIISDSQFRKHLESTPKLLDGFNIGCCAEMHMLEGKRLAAVNLFHEALQILLPLMRLEPKSNRKEVLGKRMEQWIKNIEELQREAPMSDEASGLAENCSKMKIK